MADDAERKGSCARPSRTTWARTFQGRRAAAKDAAPAVKGVVPLPVAANPVAGRDADV